jgi:photosystem II stability/assembly factor-like uncharacterized protein
MNKRPVFDSAQDLESALRAIYQHPEPDAAFASRLGRQLHQRQRGEGRLVGIGSKLALNFTAIAQALVWIAAAALLVFVLSWSIRNLIPSPAPAVPETTTPTADQTAITTSLPSPTPERIGFQHPFPETVISWAVDPLDQQNGYALLASNLLYRTNDSGITWEQLETPWSELDPGTPAQANVLGQTEITVSDSTPGLLFVRAAEALYRSDDHGQSWRIIRDGVTVWTVDDQGRNIFAWRPDFPSSEAGLWHSWNGGVSWSRISIASLPQEFNLEGQLNGEEGLLSLVIDPHNPELLYAGTQSGIFRSLDGGVSWSNFHQGLPVEQDSQVNAVMMRSAGAQNKIYALLTISRPGEEPLPLLAHVWRGRLVAGQDTWEILNEPGLQAYFDASAGGFFGVYDLLPDPKHPNRLYLASSQGLLISWDGGYTWEVFEATSGLAVWRILVTATDPAQIYLWTEAGLAILPVEPERRELEPTPQPAPTEVARPVEPVEWRLVAQAGGSLTAFTLDDDLAYLGLGPRLVVVDNSNPNNPRQIAQSGVLPGLAADMVVEEGLIYWLNQDGGLLLLDVSDLQDIRITTRIDTPAEGQMLAVQEDYAYIGEGSYFDQDSAGGLRVLDLSNFSNPFETAYLEMPDKVTELVLEEDRAYLAYQRGLLVVDISDPTQLIELAHIRTDYANITFSPPFAIIIQSAFEGEIRILDLSDPTQPERVGTMTTEGFLGGSVPTLAGDYLYSFFTTGEFGHCFSGLHALDISALSSPVQIDLPAGTPGFRCVSQAYARDRSLYLVDWDGFSIVDISNPTAPRLAGFFETTLSTRGLVISGDIVYWGDGSAQDSFYLTDLSDISRPRTNRASELSWVTGGALFSEALYLPNWYDGLVVMDVSQAADPRQAMKLDQETIGAALKAFVANEHLFISVHNDGLRILDITNPFRPELVSSYYPSEFVNVNSIAVDGNFAYLVYQFAREQPVGALDVLEISNPSNPLLIGRVNVPKESTGIAISGDYAFVTTLQWGERSQQSGTLEVLDISDATNPLVITWLELANGAYDVTLYGEYALVAAGNSGLLVVDVSTPSEPILVGHLDTSGRAVQVEVFNDRIYIADEAGGLLVVEISKPQDGFYTYTDPYYGFEFLYPTTWELDLRENHPNHIYLSKDTFILVVGYRWDIEQVFIGRTGVAAGEIETRNTISFLEEELTRDVLVYEGKDKAVLYEYAREFPIGNLVFYLSLDDIQSGPYEEVEIPESIQDEVDRILESFDLIE